VSNPGSGLLTFEPAAPNAGGSRVLQLALRYSF
jgi:hypothetical protein